MYGPTCYILTKQTSIVSNTGSLIVSVNKQYIFINCRNPILQQMSWLILYNKMVNYKAT